MEETNIAQQIETNASTGSLVATEKTSVWRSVLFFIGTTVLFGLIAAVLTTAFPNYSGCGFPQFGPCGNLGGFPMGYFSFHDFSILWISIGLIVNTLFYSAIVLVARLIVLLLAKLVKGSKSLVLVILILLLPITVPILLWIISLVVTFPGSLRDVLFYLGDLPYFIGDKIGVIDTVAYVPIERYVLMIEILISGTVLFAVFYLLTFLKSSFTVHKYYKLLFIILAVIYPVLTFIPHPSLAVIDAPSYEDLPFTVRNIIKTQTALRYNLEIKSFPEDQKVYSVRVCAADSVAAIKEFGSDSPCGFSISYMRSNSGVIEDSVGETLYDNEFIPHAGIEGLIPSNLTGKEKKLIVFIEPHTDEGGIVRGLRTYEVSLANYEIRQDLGIPKLDFPTGWKQYNNFDGYSIAVPADYVIYSSIDRSSAEPWMREAWEGSHRVNIGISEKAVAETESPQIHVRILANNLSPEEALTMYISENKFINPKGSIKKVAYQNSDSYRWDGDGTIGSPLYVMLVSQGDQYFVLQQDTDDPILTQIANSFTIYE